MWIDNKYPTPQRRGLVQPHSGITLDACSGYGDPRDDGSKESARFGPTLSLRSFALLTRTPWTKKLVDAASARKPAPPPAKADAIRQAATYGATLEWSKPAKSSSMARQVPRQVREAAVDSDMRERTGQANSCPSAPPSASPSELPVKVATASQEGCKDASGQREEVHFG